MSARGLFHTYCPAASKRDWAIFGQQLGIWGEECILMTIGRCRVSGSGEVSALGIKKWAPVVARENGFRPVRERAAQRESAKRIGTPHAALSQAQETAKEWLMDQGYRAALAEQAVRECGVGGEDAQTIFKAALKEMARLRGL